MTDFVFVTGNMDKVHWVEKFLGQKIAHHKLELDEIQDLDPVRVLEHKAKEAYRILKKPVLVEDTSLVFHALGRLPGPFVKFFKEELSSEGMARLLDGFEDRSATQVVLFAVYDGKVFLTFEGSASGLVADAPRGGFGFGFDAIFIPEGHNKTRGEMTEDEYSIVHPRKKAVLKFAEFIKG